ncbi:MAG: MBL fold metallo-hydrolase [Planctomycetota bacterium]|nr:MBL fold metallo-hydrolase [Planctomycetota bacterium]
MAAASIDPVPYAPREITVGRWRVTALQDGWLRLDGGAMWGVVPAPMWRPMTPPDDRNRILLALRPFLLRDGEHTVILELGVGDRWGQKELDRYGIERTDTLEESLAQVGVAPGEVTHLVASHAHWDHIGSAISERDGVLVPTFPGATLALPRVEADMVLDPDPIRRGSYRPEDLRTLEDAGLVRRFEDGEELLPGLFGHVLGGHSDGSSVIRLAGEDGPDGVFWGDVCPTTHHIQPPFIMAYDVNAGLSYEVRSRWLARSADEGLLGLFYHDADIAFGTIAWDGRRYTCTPIA